MKSIIEKTGKVFRRAFLVAIATYMTAAACYADTFNDAAEKSAKGIHSTVVGAVKWLLVIALVVIGLVFAFGSQRQYENAKERLPRLLIGVALVLGAVGFAGVIMGWLQ